MGASAGHDWPDIEGAMRTYLRADADLVPLVNGRVFFSSPKNAQYPIIVITRIGGGESAGEAPLDMGFLQIDCIGKKADEQGGGKGPVTQIALAVAKSISKIKSGTEIAPGVRAFNARIASSFYSPFPGDDRPRQIITAVVPSIVITATSGE